MRKDKWYNEIVKVNTRTLVIVRQLSDNKRVGKYWIDS